MLEDCLLQEKQPLYKEERENKEHQSKLMGPKGTSQCCKSHLPICATTAAESWEPRGCSFLAPSQVLSWLLSSRLV